MSFENLKDNQLKALENADGYEQACDLIGLLEKEGFEAYMVGGSVRDVMLGRTLKDFDMCTSAKPEDMKRVFEDYKLLLQGEAFGTVSVVVDKTAYEITSFRGDGSYTDARHPDSVEFKASLKEDLERRDFTINALAFHPQKGVLDFVGGVSDLEAKVLKTVGDPEGRFDEDALRIARLIRFAVQLGFEIDQKTFEAAVEKAPQLHKISKERIYTEFRKMLDGMPHLASLDWIFKTDFETAFSSQKTLNIFEKAFIALGLCQVLKVEYKDYVLEKSLKERCLSLEKISKSQSLTSDFILLCDKHNLYKQDQKDLWSLVCLIRSDASKLEVAPYSKSDVSAATLKLRQEYEGRELGQAVFDFKIKSFFQT